MTPATTHVLVILINIGVFGALAGGFVLLLRHLGRQARKNRERPENRLDSHASRLGFAIIEGQPSAPVGCAGQSMFFGPAADDVRACLRGERLGRNVRVVFGKADGQDSVATLEAAVKLGSDPSSVPAWGTSRVQYEARVECDVPAAVDIVIASRIPDSARSSGRQRPYMSGFAPIKVGRGLPQARFGEELLDSELDVFCADSQLPRMLVPALIKIREAWTREIEQPQRDSGRLWLSSGGYSLLSFSVHIDASGGTLALRFPNAHAPLALGEWAVGACALLANAASASAHVFR